MLGYESAFEHIGHRHLEGGNGAFSRDRNIRRLERRPVTRFGQRAHFSLGDMQELEPVHHYLVAAAKIANLLGVFGALADLRHGNCLEVLLQERKGIAAFGIHYRPQRKFLAAASTWQQTHPCFHQSDITFKRCHCTVAVHDELAATAQSHSIHRRHRGDGRVFQCLRGLLELRHHGFDLGQFARHQRIRDM